MKKTVFAIALAVASIGAAQAQTQTQTQNAGPKQLRFIVGMGIPGGGDKLATVTYERLGDYNIKAGGLIAFTGGVDFLVTPEFSLQSTISYHVDQANASNGDIKFKRYPIELIAYYHPAANWRVGGGVRYVSSPKLSSSGVVSGLNAEFDNTVSGLVEAEYMVQPSFGVKLRYVNEKYKVKGFKDIDANHVGLFGNFYF
jgi:hypothetical protein